MGCTLSSVSVDQRFPKFARGLWCLPPVGLRFKYLGVCGTSPRHPALPQLSVPLDRGASVSGCRSSALPSLGSCESPVEKNGWATCLLGSSWFQQTCQLRHGCEQSSFSSLTSPSPRDETSHCLSTWKGLTHLCLVTFGRLIGSRTLSLLLDPHFSPPWHYSLCCRNGS